MHIPRIVIAVSVICTIINAVWEAERASLVETSGNPRAVAWATVRVVLALLGAGLCLLWLLDS